MSIIKSIEHAVAVVAQDAVKAEQAIAEYGAKTADILRKAQVAEPTVEAVTSAIAGFAGKPALGMVAVNIERLAFASLGYLIPLAADSSAAAQEQFKNVVKDDAVRADLIAAAPKLLAAVKGQGLSA